MKFLSKHFYIFLLSALVKFHVAPSLVWKHQLVFLFSPTCRFLLLSCPSASFRMVAMEKQCLSQLICKTAYLSSFKLLLRKHFLLLSVENQVVLCAAKPKKSKMVCLVTFPSNRLCSDRTGTVNQLMNCVHSVACPYRCS